ncbi:MAG: hypothetical protein MUF85_03230 [Patescibacteria group bacterium]|jgi:hypothetical protein|nr:hypothetical protein [Patescibacteria group bacterium]
MTERSVLTAESRVDPDQQKHELLVGVFRHLKLLFADNPSLISANSMIGSQESMVVAVNLEGLTYVYTVSMVVDPKIESYNIKPSGDNPANNQESDPVASTLGTELFWTAIKLVLENDNYRITVVSITKNGMQQTIIFNDLNELERLIHIIKQMKPAP